MNHPASWYKLKTGQWGAKVRHVGRVGDAITVTNKKGEDKNMWLSSRTAKFDDAELWEITDQQPQVAEEEEPF